MVEVSSDFGRLKSMMGCSCTQSFVPQNLGVERLRIV
jgi:hypothetical protein